MSFCPGCGRAFEVPLPVEPLYTLATTALLVPMRIATLKSWLSKHRDDPGLGPAQYMGSWGRRYRMLTASDVKYIRSKVVSPHWRQAPTITSGRPKKL